MVPSHLMFERLLPDGMAVSAVQGDNYDTPLLPEEECAVASAVEKRRREFAAGRACARNALAKLGMPEVAIPRGAHGEPVWPAGAVGSITHCDGFCACAVARRELIWSVGIDAEPAVTEAGSDIRLDEEKWNAQRSIEPCGGNVEVGVRRELHARSQRQYAEPKPCGCAVGRSVVAKRDDTRQKVVGGELRDVHV